MNDTNQTAVGVKRRDEKGFTLIELMLAMSFFASVLMIATLLLMQTLTIYNRGMTVKQMNQVGRTLMEDLARVGNSGKKVQIGKTNGDVTCVSIDKTTYIWNIASATDDNDTGYKNIAYKYDNGTPTGGKPINFVKLTNTSCPATADLTLLNSADTSPVVGDTVRVYGATVRALSGQLAYISLQLGTFDSVGSSFNPVTDTEDNRLVCQGGGLGDFCAVATFNTVLYVPNGEFN